MFIGLLLVLNFHSARETAALVEFISCRFAPMTVGQLNAETAFELKCSFAIDGIAAGYGADDLPLRFSSTGI